MKNIIIESINSIDFSYRHAQKILFLNPVLHFKDYITKRTIKLITWKFLLANLVNLG